MLPVCDRIVYRISTLCHTSISVLSPHYLSDFITLYAPSRGLCSSSDTRLFSIHRPITKSYGQRTFTYQAPHVWNKLPVDLRHKSTISVFKSSLKTHIFQKNESDSTNTLYNFEKHVIWCIINIVYMFIMLLLFVVFVNYFCISYV